MDQRERLNDPQEALRLAMDGQQAKLWTAMPAQIVDYDAVRFTCTAQILIQGKLRDTSGNFSDITIPPCPDVPIVFPHGGGFGLTFPLAVGDEGLLVFASRCIDNWWSLGGIRAQFEFRMHDLSDGFFVPGPWSQPKKPAAAGSTTTVQLRKSDGTAYYEIAADGTLNVHPASGKTVQLQAPSTVGGDLTINGNTQANGNLNISAGNNLQIDSGATVKRILSGSMTFAGAVGSLSSATLTTTVTGAQVGDRVIASLRNGSPIIASWNAYVSATNTVAVQVVNSTGVAASVPSTTIDILVIGVT